MKIRKILSAAIASAVILASSASSVYALEDGEATYCFDTETAMSEWQTYGATEETGFSISHSDTVSKNGRGSILISENVSGEVGQAFGGAYVKASDLGLDNFDGCTVEMSVKLCEGAEDFCDNLSIFSDGTIWVSSDVPALSTEEWTTVTFQLPGNADNDKVGFTIPTFKAYSGGVVYIDDFAVTNADGTVIANRGDYEMKKIASQETVSKGTNIVLTILLVVLIFVVIGGIGYFVSVAIRHFS